MPLEYNDYGANQRADQALLDILGAQLVLLSAICPAQSWLLGRFMDGLFQVVASTGKEVSNIDLDKQIDWENGAWKALADGSEFEYRSLSRQEQAGLHSLMDAGSLPGNIVRYVIYDRDGYQQACLFGFGVRQLEPFSKPHVLGDHLAQILRTMAASMSLCVEFQTLEQQLIDVQRNAFIEPLTGILNRAGWADRVEHLEAIAARADEDIGLVMLDLDNLKLVNDMHGHSAGDALLRRTAQRIRTVLRASDVVGRLGGDEFGIAAKGLTPELAQALVERLRQSLDEVGIAVSIGLALKSEAESLNDALALADRRMYEDKRAKPLFEQLSVRNRASSTIFLSNDS